ncbi:MAG: alpha/beta fold hydrolase [Flavobacteriales bacterium]
MKLHYREMGEGEPLLILHGVFGSSDNWQTVGKKLSHDFRVFLIDQRNHGRSTHSEEFNYKNMSEDILELIDANDLGKVNMIGHSMGGKTAMCFANDHPERLKSMIVVDIAPKRYEKHHELILKAMEEVKPETKSGRKEVDKALSKYIEEFSIRQFIMKNLYWKNKDQLGWRLNVSTLRNKQGEVVSALDLDKIYTPTLFIRGEKSDYLKDNDIEYLKEHFLNMNLKTLNSGHWVHAEAPNEFIDTVRNYLRS